MFFYFLSFTLCHAVGVNTQYHHLYKLQKPHKDNDFSPNRTNANCKKEKSTLFLGENHGFDTDAVVSVWNFRTSSSTGLDISPSFPIGKAPDEECMR